MNHKVKDDALDSVPVRTLFAVAKHERYIPHQSWLCCAIRVLLAFAGCNRYLQTAMLDVDGFMSIVRAKHTQISLGSGHCCSFLSAKLQMS